MARRPAQDAPGEAAAPDHTARAYQGLRRMLFLGEIAPGQKLHTRDLAEHLGMSPTPVVQALKWLESQGLVRHEPNRGYTVEPTSPDEVREIYDLREQLEADLVTRATERRDEAGLAAIGRALDAHAEATREGYLRRRLVTDMEFHLAIGAAAGRGVSLGVLRHLFDLLYLKHKAESLFARPLDRVEDEHRQVYERIAAGDAEGARKALVGHLRSVRDHVLKGLARSEDEQRNLSF